MWPSNLYVLDCENEPGSKGRFVLHCIDDLRFRFHALHDIPYRRSPGDRIDVDTSNPPQLQYVPDPTSDDSRTNLPFVMRKLIIDQEMYLIQNFRKFNFGVFPYELPRVKEAFDEYPEDIHDFRDLSTVLQRDAVSYITRSFLESHSVPMVDIDTETFWNPDGSSDFEFAEKLNGFGRIEAATKFYSRSLNRGYLPAKEFLSTDFLKGMRDGLLDEDSFRRCIVINNLSDDDPDIAYHLACHHEENLRHNRSYKGATATKVVELYRKAQSAGNVKASYRLGNIYQHGLGRMSPNLSKATKAYRKCGDHPDVLFKLASCYESTYDYSVCKGVDGISAREICEIYRRSAEAGNRYARNRITLSGPSNPMSFTESRLLAHAGDDYAAYLLAQSYESGYAGSVSYEDAILWYREIIDASSDGPLFSDTISYVDDVPVLYAHDLMYRIGELYELSNLRDYHLALEWFTRSAEAGNDKAKQLIDISDVDSIPEDQVLRRLLLHSEEGDHDILTRVAGCYEFGIGTKKDLNKAKEYREILARDDDPDSLYWIASHIESKAHSKSELDDAFDWYTRAANRGHVKAKERLDIGNIKDVPEKELFAKCRLFMHTDDPDIQYALGRCYELGLGVSTSFSLAKSHYQRARQLGSSDAEDKLDRTKLNGCTGYERYRRLMLFSDEEDPEIHAEIGDMYLDGKVVERSESLAYGWFESAAGMGHVESAVKCADMMHSGQVKMDRKRMLAYYRMSADGGDVRSNRILGKVLTEPGSNEKGHPEAVRRLRDAAHRKDPESQYLLGRMFEKGLGMPQFFAEAFRWYSLASEQGHFESKYRTMLFLSAGRGTRKDVPKAKSILQELKASDPNRLLRTMDACVRGNDPLTISFKAEHLS